MQANAKNILLGCLVSALLFAVTPAHGKQLSASSDPADLRAYIERVNKMAQPTAEQLFAQANACWWLKDYKGAAAAATKAIELKPNAGDYYSFRGLMYKQQKQFDSALKDMNKAEALGFTKRSLYAERSLVKLARKDYQGASEDADKWLQHKPEDPLFLYVKGVAECEQGRAEKGIQLLSRSIELNPSDAEVIYTRGLEYRKLGRFNEANADLAKARSMGLE